MIVLAYLWLLALVPLLVHTGDAEVRWHAKHGLVLTIVEFSTLVAWTIVMSIVSIMTGGLLGCLFVLVTPLMVAAIAVLHLVGMAKALRGDRLIVPVVSQYASWF